MGYEVILVSSGAIAVGTNKLGMKTRPDSMRLRQAATLAVNQGVETIITNGKELDRIYDIINEKSVGTKFIEK